MPRKSYTTRYAKLTWSPEDDAEYNEFLPISTSTISTVSTPLVAWVRENSEAIHAVRQRHPGGKWHWHVSFRMKREFSSEYFYAKHNKKGEITREPWWGKSLKNSGFSPPQVMITPEEDRRGFGYEHQDEFEIMYTDYDADIIATATEFCAMQRNKKCRRDYLEKITTVSKAKVSHAIATAKEDYDLQSDSAAMAMLMEEGWAFEGDEVFEDLKRKRYREYIQSK